MLVATAIIKQGTDISKTKETRCLLPISIGQSYHEGEAFDATLDFLNKTFGSAVFVVADVLQAYNHENAAYDIEKARENARRDGSEWLRRNSQKFSNLKIPYRIIWWEDELQDRNYPQIFEMLSKEYESEGEFKRSLDKTAGQFFSRQFTKFSSTENSISHSVSQPTFFSKPSTVSENRLTQSRKYLMEECAVLKLWKKHDCHFLVYPKKLTPVLEYMIKKNDITLEPIALKFSPMKKHVKQPSSSHPFQSNGSTVEHFLSDYKPEHVHETEMVIQSVVDFFKTKNLSQKDYCSALTELTSFQLHILKSSLSPEVKTAMAIGITLLINSLSCGQHMIPNTVISPKRVDAISPVGRENGYSKHRETALQSYSVHQNGVTEPPLDNPSKMTVP